MVARWDAATDTAAAGDSRARRCPAWVSRGNSANSRLQGEEGGNVKEKQSSGTRWHAVRSEGGCPLPSHRPSTHGQFAATGVPYEASLTHDHAPFPLKSAPTSSTETIFFTECTFAEQPSTTPPHNGLTYGSTSQGTGTPCIPCPARPLRWTPRVRPTWPPQPPGRARGRLGSQGRARDVLAGTRAASGGGGGAGVVTCNSSKKGA